MENENDMNTSDSTYHYGRNESPFGREEINTQSSENSGVDMKQEVPKQEYPNRNPYSQGSVYGQGIYMGSDFAKEPPKKEKTKKQKKPSSGKAKKIVGFVASAVVFGLIAGGVMVGVNTIGNKALGNDNNSKKTTEISTVTTDAGIKTTEKTENDVADVVEEVMPSIVSITNTSVQRVRSWFQSYEQEVSGSGSGIIIGQDDDEIMIVTNNHVIEKAKELTVAFSDETAVEASVKGADAVSDLAVLTIKTKDIDASTLEKIKVAALGSSDDLRMGESAIAIGNALGYGQSVTVGHISAVDRDVDVDGKTMKMLQTDAAINPGNSGGALLNQKGEVIGINTVKFVDSTVEGMGYAIPISSAIPIINDLMNQQVIAEGEQGYLGIQGNDVTEDYAQSFNMPYGVYVVKIIEGSPADKCGLRAGDIITKVGERQVTSWKGLQSILSGKKAGEEVKLTIQRNSKKGEYEEVVLDVTLGARKDMPREATTEAATTEADTRESRDYFEYYDSPEDFFDQFDMFP